MTMVSLVLCPPNIVPWLSNEVRNRNILLLDFDADLEDDETLRIDLNVVFNPIPIRRGRITSADYYIGSTGAEISLKAISGTIQQYTTGAKLDVHYSSTTTRLRKVSLILKTNVGFGSINHDATEERSFTSTFASEERYLAPVHMGDTIKWVINLPRGEKAIRDFLIGNLYLFAMCAWSSQSKSGWVSIRPADIRFFDSKRRPLNSMNSLLMWYVLWKQGLKIENSNGFKVHFKETTLDAAT
jgi:hypothetical protein